MPECLQGGTVVNADTSALADILIKGKYIKAVESNVSVRSRPSGVCADIMVSTGMRRKRGWTHGPLFMGNLVQASLTFMCLVAMPLATNSLCEGS
jgi:hypothetical protein